MSQKELCNKAAHLAGFTSLAFFPGMERKVATVGADSFIKVHRLEADEDAITEIEHFENVVNAVAVSRDGTTIVAGGEDREVALFKVNKDGEYDFEKLVARSSVDIRELHFSPTSNLVAVASDDKDIHVVNADAVEEVKILSGHRGGVKTVRFDPKGKFIASTGADATLRVWDVASGEEVFIVERVFDQAKANKVAEGTGALLNRCAVAWSHDGLLLAVGGGSDVRVYARDSWEEKESFTGGDASAQISTVQFSRNGCYLLTVNTAGVALAWDVLSRATVGRRLENAAGNKLQLAVWDPDFNAVAVVGTDGSYGLVGDIIGSDKLGPHEMLDDDDEDAESFGAGAEDDEEGGELILDDPLEASGGGASRAPGKSAGYARQARYEPEVEAQPAFQPQSTPMEGKRRFMAYTYDGFITCRADSTSNLIEIEFADIERHRPIRFNDYTGYSMAAMGSLGAAFASTETKEGGETIASQVYYRPFDSWAPNSDWTISLSKGEEASCIAIGSTFVAVATSIRFLRIFSFSGIQLTVVSLIGDAVCMSGYDSMLGVVSHTPASPSLRGDQALEFQLFDVKTRQLVSKGPVCLPPKATLEWFTVLPSSMLACLDSDGYARVFTPSVMGGQWCPVLDIKTVNKPRDWFWPIGIDDDHLTGVVCKIEKRYPDVIQPVVSRHQLQVPLCKADQSEEAWSRGKIFLSHDEATQPTYDEEAEQAYTQRNMTLDKGLLNGIVAACQQDKLLRALDLAMHIKTDKALAAAIQIARRHNLPMLSEKIDLFRQTKLAEEEAAAARAEMAGYQQYDYADYDEAEHQQQEEETSRGRAPKRARAEEEEEDAGVESADEAEAATEMDTPPGAPVVSRKPANMFAIKDGASKANSATGAKFADRMKSIQLKDASAAAAKAKPAASAGFGAKAKGLGVARGSKKAK